MGSELEKERNHCSDKTVMLQYCGMKSLLIVRSTDIVVICIDQFLEVLYLKAISTEQSFT